MPGRTVALLATWIVGGSGVILILAALLLRGHAGKKKKHCSAVSNGEVVHYAFSGDRMAPVIAFAVQGETYFCRKKFKGYKITRTPRLQRAEAWEDETGFIHIKRGPAADLNGLAQALWPLGSQMQVHYDPRNPKSNYAGDPDNNSVLAGVLSAAGAGQLVLSGLLYGLILRAG